MVVLVATVEVVVAVEVCVAVDVISLQGAAGNFDEQKDSARAKLDGESRALNGPCEQTELAARVEVMKSKRWTRVHSENEDVILTEDWNALATLTRPEQRQE